MIRPAFASLALLLAAPVAGAVPSPHMPIGSFEQLAQPLPKPYHPRLASSLFQRKREWRASKEGTAMAPSRLIAPLLALLIDLGGNWCLDCRILAGTMDVPALTAFVKQHYTVVTVDIGRFDKNLQIPARYGITQRLEGVPSLLVVDPVRNRLLNAGRTAALADARSMTPQALADWLAQWVTR
jgi:thiol-disulfide isomerase/thioredoxin